MAKHGRLQFAELYDGVGEDGKPFFNPARLSIDDATERERIASALDSGSVVIGSPTMKPDVLAPAGSDEVVSVGYATDGFFVWSIGMAHYVRNYGLAPDPEFYAYLRDKDYQLEAPEPDAELEEAVYGLLENRPA